MAEISRDFPQSYREIFGQNLKTVRSKLLIHRLISNVHSHPVIGEDVKRLSRMFKN
jgi:transcriptional regulator of NAD metabolism